MLDLSSNRFEHGVLGQQVYQTPQGSSLNGSQYQRSNRRGPTNLVYNNLNGLLNLTCAGGMP